MGVRCLFISTLSIVRGYICSTVKQFWSRVTTCASPALVWAEWMLQSPSFGSVLHLLLCLCKTCNVIHHDSIEMSQDRDFGFPGGTKSHRCKLRRDTVSKCAGWLNCFGEYVGLLCKYSIWGWICSCLKYSARFPSLNISGCDPVSLAHHYPCPHTPSLCPSIERSQLL